MRRLLDDVLQAELPHDRPVVLDLRQWRVLLGEVTALGGGLADRRPRVFGTGLLEGSIVSLGPAASGLDGAPVHTAYVPRDPNDPHPLVEYDSLFVVDEVALPYAWVAPWKVIPADTSAAQPGDRVYLDVDDNVGTWTLDPPADQIVIGAVLVADEEGAILLNPGGVRHRDPRRVDVQGADFGNDDVTLVFGEAGEGEVQITGQLVQFMYSASGKTITLPPLLSQQLTLHHLAAGSEDVDVDDSEGATIGTLSPGEAALVYSPSGVAGATQFILLGTSTPP